MRIGFGYDAHAFAPGRPLVLGGVDLGYHMGLAGHSDADAAVHALIDAICGAVCLGDIGTLFPDTDPKYSGISSLLLLESTAKLALGYGYRLGNCDITIVAQAPKIVPFAMQMRENIANALNVQASCVSIKATTEEGMGFSGRGEGIKCYAVCLMQKI
ncbi:MAG: 2-C-methyl-D-erythritol 2,4-cyclodiphosphate synthase [Eubacteriaceae bacterium]|jgi:2-C-methyl-D-erythritol 2,4-cyclodiphosphate synthase|nr:2-C-methyl-D-erythritol 2,4-cyclodiphosphate synthase [Eubacteriaceae bacterium]